MTMNGYAKLALDLKVWCSLGDIGMREELQSQFGHILLSSSIFFLLLLLLNKSMH
jgi:hypothetical protein